MLLAENTGTAQQLAEATGAAAALAEAAARARRLGRPVLVSWTRPANLHDAIDVFAAAASAPQRALWLRPAMGEALVAIGCAHRLVGSGPQRFEQVSAAWRDLLTGAVIDATSPGPVLFGGFSFDPLQPTSLLWTGFPDGRMVLPERLVTMRGGAAWVTTNAVVGAEPQPTPPAAPTGETPPPLSADEWRALVQRVARGVGQSDLGVSKVVLARAQPVRVRRSNQDALRDLAARYPECTVFAISQGEACFLGATPERLIALHAGTASTMALAGSAPRGETPAEDARLGDLLLASPKERSEHAVVVAALREGLGQACTGIVTEAQPAVHKLANVQHLLTPVRGHVVSGRSVLDLLAHLHPTPAVGGYPRAAALELIRRHEALDRGWYAGPIGWMDANGEGEFVVGLRSGLVRGDTATLFAGCGIVADSDPVAEAAEWGWKLRPMLAALGAEA
ncbi:MAG TPA: isochorismate synthase [Chloroflexota bacterium]|nr:isochorismate synthase [Chloroflexota bacterium]